MTGIDRLNIHECQKVIRFIDDADWPFTSDEFTEDAGLQIRRVLLGHRARGGRVGHPCRENTNQSISSVTAAFWLISSPWVRSAAIPCWKSSSFSRAKNESARRADFSMKV